MVVWVRAMGRVVRRRETRPMLTRSLIPKDRLARSDITIQPSRIVVIRSLYRVLWPPCVIWERTIGNWSGGCSICVLTSGMCCLRAQFPEEKSQVQQESKADERGKFVEVVDSGRNPPDYHRQAVDRMGGFQAGKLARIGAQKPVCGMYNCDGYGRQLEEEESGDLSASRRLLVTHGTSSSRERHPSYPASDQPETRHVGLSARPSAASLPLPPSSPPFLSPSLPSSFALPLLAESPPYVQIAMGPHSSSRSERVEFENCHIRIGLVDMEARIRPDTAVDCWEA